MGISLIKHSFLGTSVLGNPHMGWNSISKRWQEATCLEVMSIYEHGWDRVRSPTGTSPSQSNSRRLRNVLNPQNCRRKQHEATVEGYQQFYFYYSMLSENRSTTLLPQVSGSENLM
jgi:hypothetical protein